MTEKPVALVSMPTLAADVPSFQLALLTPTLRRAGIETEPMSLFMEFGRRIGWPLNDTLATVYPCMAGEWIWSKAAFGADFDADVDGYLDRFAPSLDTIATQGGCTVDDLVRIRDEAAPAFVEWAVDHVDWSAYSVVGFTVVFQQMVASLALAKALKRRHPDLPVIFGGATFEDDIALEIMARNPEVDYVHCGDADLTLPEIVGRIRRRESMTGMRGVVRRADDERGVVRIVYEGRAPNLEDLDLTPFPDFDEYYARRRSTGYDPGGPTVMLPFEAARGCWYGMKNHCTFCGLNRSGMEFRRKNPDLVLDMLKRLANRYGTLYFNAIDNILAPAYMSRLFGRLAEGHSDLRIHYEIRPNLNRRQLGDMRRGGLTSVQPGIESFSSHVLALMKKGTTGVKNLELLKWTTYYGIRNSYNILYGFPGETADDYDRQADVLRKIPHFQPPYAICQARPDRGSPMFEDPEKHSITMLRPSACYRHIYPSDYDLRRVSYYFEHQVGDILPPSGYQECIKLVDEWTARWHGADRPTLRYVKTWESLSIHDRRNGHARGYRYDGERAALYELCAESKSRDEITAAFEGDTEWIDGALAEFVDLDLVILLDDRYLALALPDNPHH